LWPAARGVRWAEGVGEGQCVWAWDWWFSSSRSSMMHGDLDSVPEDKMWWCRCGSLLSIANRGGLSQSSHQAVGASCPGQPKKEGLRSGTSLGKSDPALSLKARRPSTKGSFEFNPLVPADILIPSLRHEREGASPTGNLSVLALGRWRTVAR
jgi:hypothetical protein